MKTIATFIVFLTASALACTAEPSFKSGQFACDHKGRRMCPEGYQCGGGDMCWRDGDKPGTSSEDKDAAADLGVTSDLGPDAPSVPAGAPGGGGATSTGGASGTIGGIGGATGSGGASAPIGGGGSGEATIGLGGATGTGGASASIGSGGIVGTGGSTGTAGCMADTERDPHNCGACGKECVGDCLASVCQPAALAEAQTSLAGLAVDDSYIYWINTGGGANNGSVARVQKSARPPVVETLSSNEARPSAIAVNATGIFWANMGSQGGTDGAIRGLLKSGGPAFDVAKNQRMPRSIAANLATVYWVTSMSSSAVAQIWSAEAAASSPASPIVSASISTLVFQRLAVDAANLYWAQTTSCNGSSTSYCNYAVQKVSLSNLQATSTNMGGNSDHQSGLDLRFALSGGKVYYSLSVGWIGDGSSYSKKFTVQTSGIAADSSLFWAQDGAIMKSALPLTMGLTGATQHVAATSPSEIALDQDNVYYLEPTTGQVMVAPR